MLGFCKVPGANTVFGTECAVEAGVVGKTTGGTHLPCRLAGQEHLTGQQESSQHDVAVDTKAHLFAEGVGQIILGHEAGTGNFFQRQVLADMLADVVQRFLHQGRKLLLGKFLALRCP